MRIGIATITSTALVGGVLVAVPAHPLLPVTAVAQAQEAPFATATGQVIDLALLQDSVDPASQGAFLELLDAIRADAQYPGNLTDSASIDVTLLEGINLNIGALPIPLTDLLGIEGDLGVLGASASTPAGNEAFASAGVLNDDGSINLDAHQGTGGVETVMDLTTLLQGSDLDAITDGVIDELSLRLGAVSASAERNGDEVTSEYALANVGLTLDSSLVEQLVTTLISEDTANPGLGVQVDNLVDQVAGEESLVSEVNGLLGSAFSLLETLTGSLINIDEPTIELGTDIQGTLQALLGQTLTSTTEVVSINLATGEISINLEKLAGTSAVDPNTNLLSEAAIQQISNEISTLLNGVLDQVDDAINDGLLDTSVNVNLGVSILGQNLTGITLDGSLNEFFDETAAVSVVIGDYNVTSVENLLRGLLGTVGTTVQDAIDGAVQPLLGSVLDGLAPAVVAPLVGGLSDLLRDADVLRLTLNDQPNPQVVGSLVRDDEARPNSATGPITNPDDAFTVSALRVNVLDGLIDLPLARATVNADADWSDGVAPTIRPIGDKTGVVGNEIDTFDVVVTPGTAVVTVDGLPDGVDYNPVTGEISGTPTQVETATVTVTAVSDGQTVEETFIFTVTDVGANAPDVTPIDDQEGTVGEEIDDIPVEVTPEDTEISVDGLPEGVDYNPTTGVIEGIPAEGTEGSHTVTVSATNDEGTDTETFILIVRDADTTPPTSSIGGNGSSDFLQQCLSSPAAGVAGLLAAIGAVAAIGGPALEPLLKSIGTELDLQLRSLTGVTSGAHQPQWVRNINKGLNDAANAVDSRMVTNALFATAVLALVSAPTLCGAENSSSSSS